MYYVINEVFLTLSNDGVSIDASKDNRNKNSINIQNALVNRHCTNTVNN